MQASNNRDSRSREEAKVAPYSKPPNTPEDLPLMDINDNDRLYLKKALSTNSAILFVGAGFSASATNKLKQSIPVGSAFAKTLWSFLGYKGDYDGTALQTLFDAAL